MSEHSTTTGPDAGTAPAAEYEAPRVESVVTSDQLEREANYGGISMNQGGVSLK